MLFFEQNRKKRSVTWKWVCLGKFLDSFQNLAINQKKRLAFSDEHIMHRNVHYSVPFGNNLFFRAIYFVADLEKNAL